MSVLILKPVGQSQLFQEAFESVGERVLCLSLLSLVSLSFDPAEFKNFEQILESERIVVTSANVIPVLQDWLVQSGLNYPSDPARWCTMGEGTAQALKVNLNIVGAHAPSEGVGSEALFKLPIWEQVDQVGFLKGQGGRTWLIDQLNHQGIRTLSADLYHRVWLSPNLQEWKILKNWIFEKELRAIIATSGEILERFVGQARSKLELNLLFKVPIMVPGKRLESKARALGFEHVVVTQTPAASDFLRHF